MNAQEAHAHWWANEGSAMHPLPDEDVEEFAHRITQIAWSNGAHVEREACAKHFEGSDAFVYRSEVAAAIRARSTT